MQGFRSILITVIVAATIFFIGCEKDVDEQRPEVVIENPLNCDSIKQGEFLKLKATFTDNEELARFAVDIHHNFDHSSYAPGDQGCDFGPDKTAFNPFKYGIVEEIPAGLKTYTTEFNIIVPEGTDDGDYFLVVYAQDKRGLQNWYSISLKFWNEDIKD